MTLPLVALTGEEVAFALLRNGFVFRGRDEQSIYVDKGFRHVAVPVSASIAPDTLLLLLREAGVPYVELIAMLDDVKALAERMPSKHESQVRTRIAHRPPTAKRHAR